MRVISHGATLVELLVSIFIVAILMTVFADIITQYSVVIRHQDKKDRSLANIRMALDTVTSEIEEALVIYSPDSDGGELTEVSFWRYNPENIDRKITERGGITVHYYLESGTLFREVNTDDGTRTAYPVAHEVTGFSVRREHSRLFTVSVSLEESQRIYSVDGKASLRSGI